MIPHTVLSTILKGDVSVSRQVRAKSDLHDGPPLILIFWVCLVDAQSDLGLGNFEAMSTLWS